MNPILLSIIIIPVIEIYLLIKIGSQIGAIITIIYYASMGNFDLAFPYIGSTILSGITIWGIFIHNSTPWDSL